MGDSKRRRDRGSDDPLERTVAQLHEAIEDADHLRRILSMPEFERERILADLPGVIESFAPQGDGVEYDQARTWHRVVAAAVRQRVSGER